jgi:hypothetical protein
MLLSVVKMETVLEGCITEQQRSVVNFLWIKELTAKDIHKEMFPVYVGSVCHVKRFHLGGKRFADDEEVETEVRKWLRQQSKTSMLRVSTHW